MKLTFDPAALPRVPLAAAGAILAGLLIAALTRPDATVAAVPTPTAPVIGSTTVCPGVLPASGTTGTVGVAAAPVRGATGEVSVGPVTGDAQRVLDRSGIAREGLPAPTDAVVVRARGSLTGNVAAGQVDRATAGTSTGLASVPCTPPAAQWWFTGAATTVGHSAQLVLTNVDDAAAAVDITVLTPDGPVTPRLGSDLLVEPRSRRMFLIEDLVPDEPTIAVRVTTRTGRVAAALRQLRARGLTAWGADWLPGAQLPAPELLIPGVPPGPAGRTLILANGEDIDITAEIQVTAADGQFVPTGLDVVSVAAGSTAAVDLGPALGRSAGAVRIRTDLGALFGTVVAEESGSRRDVSYSGPAAPLQGAAVLPGWVPRGAMLILSATDRASAVTVAALPESGAARPPTRVAVPAGRTVTVPLAPLLAGVGKAAVVVTPAADAGPVVAGWYAVERAAAGPLSTGYALRGGAAEVALPRVRLDPLVSARTDAD